MRRGKNRQWSTSAGSGFGLQCPQLFDGQLHAGLVVLGLFLPRDLFLPALLCQAVLSGAIGAIGTFYNLFGPSCARAREAVVAGSIDTGREFMARFQTAISRVLGSGSIWTFLRAAMRRKPSSPP